MVPHPNGRRFEPAPNIDLLCPELRGFNRCNLAELRHRTVGPIGTAETVSERYISHYGGEWPEYLVVIVSEQRYSGQGGHYHRVGFSQRNFFDAI